MHACVFILGASYHHAYCSLSIINLKHVLHHCNIRSFMYCLYITMFLSCLPGCILSCLPAFYICHMCYDEIDMHMARVRIFSERIRKMSNIYDCRSDITLSTRYQRNRITKVGCRHMYYTVLTCLNDEILQINH